MASESFAKGNEAFVCEDYETAEEYYTKAIELDASHDEYFVARSHARTKLEKYQDAISDASKALEINDKNAKAHFRKGVALFSVEDYEAAYESFTSAKALDESVKNISTWLRKCEAELDLKKKTSEMTSPDSKKAEAKAGSGDEQTKAQTSTEPSTPVIPMPSGPKTKYDWYQTETHVVVTILIKNVKKEELKTDIQEKQLSVSIKLPSGSEYALHLDLLHPIAPDQSQVKILQTKIEIKLKKVEGIRWNKLEGEPEENIKYFKPEPATVATMKYPSSSHFNRDWDKLVADIKKEEKNEKLEGDAALNQLFQQIYAEGSDDVKKAMNKSFLESGGTVLSTNWQEIASKKTEIKPPDGMEYKTYPSNSQ